MKSKIDLRVLGLGSNPNWVLDFHDSFNDSVDKDFSASSSSLYHRTLITYHVWF